MKLIQVLDRFVVPLLGLAAVAVLWEIAAARDWLDDQSFPSLHAAVARGWELLTNADFLTFAGDTLRAWATGLVIAVVLAIPLGVLLGLHEWSYNFVRVPLEAIRPIPPIVILPLALLVIGGGLRYQATLIVQGAFWPLLIAVMYGMRASDPVRLDTARSFHVGAARTLFLVRLPAAAPQIAAGLRLAAATAFAVTLVTEMVGGELGMGTQLVMAESGGDATTLFAVTLIVGLVGLAIALMFGLLERLFLGWRETGS